MSSIEVEEKSKSLAMTKDVVENNLTPSTSMAQGESVDTTQLLRRLGNRQIQLIAIGKMNMYSDYLDLC